MSLNGLDCAEVQEAYEAVSAEFGGWFLLKYASRDEVELLARGHGGVIEMRNTIAKYEEVSPLYGFLRYRRRNVIVKYMPDDCSRLVQARAVVHFNAVCERFTPYSIVFDITTAKDLKDSKLSSACSLHAASGSSSSSSSSLRRRRLNEIVEEVEEEERDRKRQSVVKEEERPASSIYSERPRSPLLPEPLVLDRQQINIPQETNFASTSVVPNFAGAERPTSPAAQSEYDQRMSSQTTRPELFSSATYTYGKPKVKLGPRPSLDVSKRPSTAGNFRPVAALPAGFKFFSRGSKKGTSQDQEVDEQSGQNGHSASDVGPPAYINTPDVLHEAAVNQLPPRPATSSGASIKSMTSSMATSTKESKVTPEKARLMKAMKLREKKKMMSAMSPQPSASNKSPPIMEEKEMPDEQGSEEPFHDKKSDNIRSFSNTDSGVAADLPTAITINSDTHSDDTISDSHPPSPTAASSSEIGDSTKASSLSELTDETIQASKGTGAETDDEDADDGPEELSEIIEEAGLRMSAVETPEDNPPEAAQSPEPVTGETDVSDGEDDPTTKVAEESHEILEIEQPPLQTRESEVKESIEVDSTRPRETSDARPLEIALSGNDSKPRKSPPLGIPLSKFSSNDQRSPTSTSSKSPTTPSLKSKFSRQDLTIPSDPVPAVPVTGYTATPVIDESEPSEATNPQLRLPTPPKSARRKTGIEPIRTDFTAKSTPHSEYSDPLLDDDALMEELQSATVQQARPMPLSKSPITPVFPNHNPLKLRVQPSRTVSSPMRGTLQVPVPGDVSQSSARSVSSGGAAYLHTITRQASSAGLQSKKNNLGSGISQRIKALEALSGSPGGEDGRPRTATPSSTFFTVRKPTAREPSNSPSVVDRASSLTRQTPTPDFSRESTPDAQGNGRRERSGSVASRLNKFEGQGASPGRPESIQVTARIIRGSNQTSKKPEQYQDPAEPSTLDLKQSPLLVDVQRAELPEQLPIAEQTPVETPQETIQERRERKTTSEDGERKAKRRSSLNIMRDFIKDRSTSSKSADNLAVMSPAPSWAKSPARPPSAHHNSGGFARRLSISSRRSSFSPEQDNEATPTPLSPVAFSDGSEDDGKGTNDKKSKNRASRFMRRLSNSFVGGRKNGTAHISPTLAEEDADQLASLSATGPHIASQPTIVAYMGDVNVQFPDNLLWKRRSMCLDSQGFLFLSAIQGSNGKEKTAGVGTKRYHLSDFRTPYVPDVEVQELPNSVVLDLMEGSCLQVACEDRAGQLSVLHTLQDAHQSQASHGP
ncbi:Uu.00g003720.m01.CDS01 [Anthostomella pinea]|uniref:Uu.00g003720.m01.CDS01 n=1 Tax=Anthostomella pinea TaxID=933095 RepID=A0AAI8YIR7_9PEZI|nr:Uu.00g003720.m01.CDS01 [Anthostomella pinea]